MMRDVADKGHLWFLPTESAFGANGEQIAHPMLAPTGLKTTDGHPLLVNDVFRIVHDFYGHTQHGFQFGPVGEYNAYREHSQMYSDAAFRRWLRRHLHRMPGSTSAHICGALTAPCRSRENKDTSPPQSGHSVTRRPT
jgi:hypothetical protein